MVRRSAAFDILAAANPVDDASLPTADSRKAQVLLGEIVSSPRPRPRRRQPFKILSRRRAIVLALLAPLLIAAAWVLLRPVSDPVSVGCYQAPSLDSDIVAVASGGSLDVEICAPVWEEGRLVNSAATPPGGIPPLVGCVSDDGGFAVFPSDDRNLCSRLGLGNPDPESLPSGDAIRRLNDALVAYFVGRDCVPIDVAQHDIAQILTDHGFSAWHVKLSPGGSDRPCASFGLDAEGAAVHLIPVPASVVAP